MGNEDIYVVIADNDLPQTFGDDEVYDDKGQLVFEQYTKEASLEEIKEKAKRMEGNGYGKCRIAKLVFIEEEG